MHRWRWSWWWLCLVVMVVVVVVVVHFGCKPLSTRSSCGCFGWCSSATLTQRLYWAHFMDLVALVCVRSLLLPQPLVLPFFAVVETWIVDVIKRLIRPKVFPRSHDCSASISRAINIDRDDLPQGTEHDLDHPAPLCVCERRPTSRESINSSCIMCMHQI